MGFPNAGNEKKTNLSEEKISKRWRFLINSDVIDNGRGASYGMHLFYVEGRVAVNYTMSYVFCETPLREKDWVFRKYNKV